MLCFFGRELVFANQGVAEVCPDLACACGFGRDGEHDYYYYFFFCMFALRVTKENYWG